tara:strand:- start:484 stop:705 length:222 start_codon:yes stop_codon:yes gene_type:complete
LFFRFEEWSLGFVVTITNNKKNDPNSKFFVARRFVLYMVRPPLLDKHEFLRQLLIDCVNSFSGISMALTPLGC